MSKAPLLVIALWLAASPAGAAELHARGPKQCADTAELGFRVERAIGMPLERAAQLRFDVEFAAVPAGFTAQLGVGASDASSASKSASKERRLSAPDCSQLADAVAVAIALALGASEPAPTPLASTPSLDSQATSEAWSTDAAATSASSTPNRAAEPASDDGRDSSQRGHAAWTPALSAALVLDSGSLPSPGFGVSVGAELRAERFAVRALGTLLFDQHAGLPGAPPPAGADLSLLLGSLSACAAPFGSLQAPLSPSLCGGWELGRLAGTGTGVSTPHQGSELWSAPRLDAGLAWTVPGTLLRFGTQLTLALPLNRDNFVLRDLGTVHRPPSAVGRWAVGFDVGFE